MHKTEEVKYNGVFLWQRASRSDRIIYARQLEPTFELGPNDKENKLQYEIQVGYETETGTSLENLLSELYELRQENEFLKKNNEALTSEKLMDDHLVLEQRLDRLEKPWWKRK